ncbi:MAG: hypothetical protein Kow00124_06010 [Anaerolineae bacterium]
MSSYPGDDSLVDQDDLPEGHRSGFVAVIGKPNVGKSTLMNALLGEKLAIVSPRPQTTRDRQLGILTLPEAQVIFVDTPGIHIARTPLGEYMVEVAAEAIPDSDLILFLVDVSEPPDEADRQIAALIAAHEGAPVILVLNKIDLLDSEPGEVRDTRCADFTALLPGAAPLRVSAAEGRGVEQLQAMILAALPEGPRYYPPDQLTDTHLRENAAELIREQVLLRYEQEVPHAVAVQIEEFKERSDNMTYIRATIFVEKDSQKAILIGKKGAALKELGQAARAELEALLGTQVYLDLWVKVLKNWRRDPRALRRLGYYKKD